MIQKIILKAHGPISPAMNSGSVHVERQALRAPIALRIPCCPAWPTQLCTSRKSVKVSQVRSFKRLQLGSWRDVPWRTHGSVQGRGATITVAGFVWCCLVGLLGICLVGLLLCWFVAWLGIRLDGWLVSWCLGPFFSPVGVNMVASNDQRLGITRAQNHATSQGDMSMCHNQPSKKGIHDGRWTRDVPFLMLGLLQPAGGIQLESPSVVTPRVGLCTTTWNCFDKIALLVSQLNCN